MTGDPATAAALEELERACGLLVKASPEALDGSAAALAAAAAALDARRRPAPAQAARLRQELKRARCLLESAAGFRLGWSRRAGSITGGYRCDGEPAAIERPARCLATG